MTGWTRIKRKKKMIFMLLRVFASSRLCVKKSFFIFIFAVLFSISAFAQTDSKAVNKKLPADFKSDGCSLFFDGDYRDCCVEHDKAYFFGGSSKERWQADKKLYKCVAAKKGFHHKIIAPIMWLGIRIGGVSWLPTPFRWGFGREKSPRFCASKCQKKIS
jgi:hypothetical protein